MLIKKILDWFLPYVCILCENPSNREQDLCLPCLNDLPTALNPCKKCSIALPTSVNPLYCGNCLIHPPPFNIAHSLFVYQPPLTRLILELKFKKALAHARVLGELLAEKIQQDWYKNKPLPEVIFPIPLHVRRLKERGFNQALEIARPISKKLSIPLDAQSSFRRKATLPQATLVAKSRLSNIKDAFIIQDTVTNRHIAVVDDLITTGSTMNEFCKTLRQHGAKTVDVWCAARPKML